MNNLTMLKDGVNATDLGIIGSWQYALSFLGGAAAGVYRRRADEAGSYGGWRFECSSGHPQKYAAKNVATWQGGRTLAELAERIEAAIDSRRMQS